MDKFDDTSYGDNRLFGIGDGLPKHEVNSKFADYRFRYWFFGYNVGPKETQRG